MSERPLIYVSVDIETGGLSHACPILEIACIVEDTLYPKPLADLRKHRILIIDDYGRYDLEPVAAIMHAKSGLLTELHAALKMYEDECACDDEGFEFVTHEGTLICTEKNFGHFFNAFLDSVREPDKNITIAGKNFAMFDLPFMLARHAIYNNHDLNLPIKHRVFDVGPRYFEMNDAEVPSTKICAERAGIQATESHTAMQDAWEVIQMHRAAK